MSTIYTHIRPEAPTKQDKHRTFAGVYNEQENTMQIGRSECSLNDQFNKKIGRKIAEGRANKSPEFTLTVNSPEQARNAFFTYCGREKEVTNNVQ